MPRPPCPPPPRILRLAATLCAALAAALAAPASAADLDATPAIQIRQTYDDNVQFKSVSDLETRVRPSLRLDADTGRTRTALTGTLDLYRYREHTAFDRENQQYTLEIAHAATQSLDLALDAGLDKGNTLDSALSSAGLVVEQHPSLAHNARMTATWKPDPRTSLALAPGYRTTRNDGKGNADHDVLGADLSWARLLDGGRLTVFLLGGVQTAGFEFEGGSSTQRTLRLLAGAGYAFSPRLTGHLRVGPARSWASVTVRGTQDSFSDTGYVIDSLLRWKGETLILETTLERGSIQSVIGEEITRTRLGGSASRRLARHLWVELAASAFQSTSQGYVSKRNSVVAEVSPSLRWRMTDAAELVLAHRYSAIDNRITDRSQCRRQTFLQVSATF